MDDATGCKPPLTQNDNISNVSISTLPNYDNSASSELSSLPDSHPIFETWLAPSDTHRNTEVNHLHHSWNNFPSDISKSTLDLNIDNSELNFSHMNLSDTNQKDISEALSVSHETERCMQHDTSSCNEHEISEVLKDMSLDISNQDATSVTYDANGISVLVDSEASMSVLEQTPLISDGNSKSAESLSSSSNIDITHLQSSTIELDYTPVNSSSINGNDLSGTPSCNFDESDIFDGALPKTNLDQENDISILVDDDVFSSFLERTPLICDGILTPNSSQINDSIVEEFSAKNKDNTESSKEKYIMDTLVGAGYSLLVVKEILSTSEKRTSEQHGETKSRPLTQIFTQGQVYTYDKLELGNSKKNQAMPSKSRENVLSSNLGHKVSTSSSKLNPEAPPFTSNRTVGNNPIRLGHDALTILKNIRIENMKNVIIGQLNINSLRNKHHALVELLRGNLDILVITETKLDGTFPEKQFYIPGYKKPFRKDRNKNGGGVMIYVREDIPSDILMKHNIGETLRPFLWKLICVRTNCY